MAPQSQEALDKRVTEGRRVSRVRKTRGQQPPDPESV